ncbi:sulfurtransferase [Algoriphagus sp. A40]|uniref:sulfurtransferase n=1 Tax=Algoriphagus sp. A40 TaxID=1945863 RepID=UPI0020C2E53B|nr:sulfurtransferase [Algoriphagus sp. A40]
MKILFDPNLVIVDARNSSNPKNTYEKGHLKGARFVDPNLDLADIKANLADGGRHPLPKLEDFCKTLGRLGIKPESRVVVYDDQKGANSAARFWWMLRAVGHDKVQVLEGGFQAALAAGIPVSTHWEEPKPTSPYPAERWTLGIATMDEVEEVAWDKDHLIIDVRSPERYRGETEPIDLIAGHIPGAENVPFTENLDENGNFLSPEKLRDKYEELLDDLPNEHIIVHCGSGVTACHTLLALEHAGLGIPKLYVGSWSEWSRNDKPIGKSVG